MLLIVLFSAPVKQSSIQTIKKSTAAPKTIDITILYQNNRIRMSDGISVAQLTAAPSCMRSGAPAHGTAGAQAETAATTSSNACSKWGEISSARPMREKRRIHTTKSQPISMLSRAVGKKATPPEIQR
jgi:hypothetical protein